MVEIPDIVYNDCVTKVILHTNLNTKKNAMVKVHYCVKCDRISYSTVRIFICRRCDSKCKRFKIEFVDFMNLGMDDRKAYVDTHK